LNKWLIFFTFLLVCFSVVSNAVFFDVHGEDVNNGAISITFDDNYSNQLDYAWESMAARGIVGTFYVLTNTVNSQGYLNYGDLQSLQAAGNEIASHSVSHTSFDSLSDTQIRDECLNSKTILESNGLFVSNFAYPNGVTASHIDSIVDDYYSSGRTAFVSPYLVELPNNQFRVPGFNKENNVNELILLKDMVDQLYNTNSWGVFLFHNVLPGDYSSLYTTSQEDFEEFLDYVILKGLSTITISQGLEVVNLSMDTNIGSVSPPSGKYILGSDVVVEAFAPVAGVGERFVWEGWFGSGVGSYTGVDNPVTFTMNNSISEILSWNHQYAILINQNGAGSELSTNIVTINGLGYVNGDSLWLDSGSTHSYFFTQEFLVNQNKKYAWFSSSGLTTQQAGSIFISGSGSITANYKTQYYVDVISPYGNVSGAGWYYLDEYVSAKIDQTIIEINGDTRHVFTGWMGDGSGFGTTSDRILVNKSLLLIASWEKEYLFIFNQEGLPIDHESSLILNSQKLNIPLFIWIMEGELVEYTYLDKISTGFGTQYVLTSQTNQSPLTSNSPISITATYNSQYTSDFFVTIAIIIIIMSLVFAIIFLWKKKLI